MVARQCAPHQSGHCLAWLSARPKPAFGGIGDVPVRPDYGLEGVRIRLRSRAVATARLRSLVPPDRSSRAGVPGAARVSQAAFPGGSGVRADGLAGTLAALSLPRHGPADRDRWAWRSLRARPPLPTHSAAGLVSPIASATRMLPRKRIT